MKSAEEGILSRERGSNLLSFNKSACLENAEIEKLCNCEAVGAAFVYEAADNSHSDYCKEEF